MKSGALDGQYGPLRSLSSGETSSHHCIVSVLRNGDPVKRDVFQNAQIDLLLSVHEEIVIGRGK
ncbi:MAG: hypothetical protein IT290_08495 [Deltaproteobacteria bacterium]|nr:hypothetical protein [Deltaproteobacteria bacterium]